MYGQDEMVDILTEWNNADKFCHTLGGASLNGNMYVLDASPSDNGSTHNTWLLFGDPSLLVRTDNPTSMNVSLTPSVLMLGMSSLEITTENTPYGIATLMMNGEVIATSRIYNNVAELTFAPMTNVGNATLTVIGYNKVTEIINVEVLPAEGPYVTVAGYTPNFSAVNQETNLSITFKNVGVDPTNGTTSVELSCDDERLTILDGTSEFDVLPAEETVTLQDAFSFIVAEGVEDGTRFQIDIVMTEGRQTWNGKVFVTAGQAILDYANASWPGSFTPGEELTVMANFKNVGHYMATHAIAHISCENEYVTLLNNDIEVGTLDPEGIATCPFRIAIDPECPTTEQITLHFTIEADGGLTAEGSIIMKNSCIVVVEMTDSYGDGWNGNKLKLSFSDGTPDMELTFTSGSTHTENIEIGNGVHVTLTWISGNYTYECSFTVKYENGTLIYSGSSPSSSLHYEFDCDCLGGDTPIMNFNPVVNLAADVTEPEVTLTWETPEGSPINYIIYRNGLEIGQTTDTIYTEETDQLINYTYCVVAEYDGGVSTPECVIADLTSIDENASAFAIYPNPANSILYINSGNTEFSYVMYNGMGQVVANGNGQGTEQINVEGLTKGVYFIRLTTGTQVRMEKVVVR